MQDPQISQKSVRFQLPTQNVQQDNGNQGNRIQQIQQGGQRLILQPIQQSINVARSGSQTSSAIQELRNSFQSQTNKLSTSRLSESTVPLNETVQTIRTTPSNNRTGACQPLAQCQPVPQHMCQPVCQPFNPCQQVQQPYIVCANSEKKKKRKKYKEIEQVQVQVTPKRESKIHHKNPEIDTIKKEIHELERIIRALEIQPQQQKDVEVHIEDNKKCLKKLCKKIKILEKELYEVARQRDEALIVRTQLERDNKEMYDRIGQIEELLKSADQKIFDLSIVNERQSGYIKQTESDLQRLRKKKKKKVQPEIKEVIVEKIVEVPFETIKHVPVEKIVDRPYEVIKEVPVERIVEKIIEIPKIEYVDRPVTQFVEIVKEVPVDRIVEVPYPQDRIVQVPVDRVVYKDRVVEVPVERRVEVPVDRIVYQDRYIDVPVERRVEVPVDRIVYKDRVVEIPVEKRIEVPVERVVEIPRIEYVDRPVYIQVPVDRMVEQPIDRPVYIEVPVDRVVQQRVEVPVDHFIETRDDREINKLKEENTQLLEELHVVREKLRREIELNRIQDRSEEVHYLRDQLRAQDQAFNASYQENDDWRSRCGQLEAALMRERQIVSDLQDRLDQMYHQVEVVTEENNRKNDEFKQHLDQLHHAYKQKKQKTPVRVVEQLVQNSSPQINIQHPIQQQQQQLFTGQPQYPYPNYQNPAQFQQFQPQFQQNQPGLYNPQVNPSQQGPQQRGNSLSPIRQLLDSV